MKLSPEQVRQIAQHYLNKGEHADAVAAFQLASDTGDALSTVFLATFVRDGNVLTTSAVAQEAPTALECWHNAIDREQSETPAKTISAREMKRMLATFASEAKESA